MKYSNSPNLLNNEKGSVVINKFFRNYVRQTLNNDEAYLLPNVFVDYAFSDAEHPVVVSGNKPLLKFPKVNEILTAYCKDCLQIYITIAFIELVNQQSYSPDLYSFKDQKLEYAVSLYNRLFNLPTISDSAKAVLTYYLTGSLDWIGTVSDSNTKLNNLKNSLKIIEAKYSELLIQEVLPNTVFDAKGRPLDAAAVKWFDTQKAGKVLDQIIAQWFINRANEEMVKDIEVRFAENQLRAIMFNADSIVSDPRFRMSLEDKRWHEYDETIKKEVAFYNQKFADTPGFVPLDWRYVKAMIWTEVMAGPQNDPKQWQIFPMQIGRFVEDKGYDTVRNRKEDEGADLVVPPELSEKIKDKSRMIGNLNVSAGIAYLYVRYVDGVKTEDISVGLILTTTVQKNEFGFDVIAKRLKTTTANNIKINNPEVDSKKLQVGQEIKYQQAKAVRSVSNWKDWMEAIRIYNIGDPEYMTKVKKAYQIITSRTPK